jgi:hypothetical protein
MFSVFYCGLYQTFFNSFKTFEEMGLVEQVAVTFMNSLARGNEYDINDSWKA